MAVLPPPYTATRRPLTGRPPLATVCRNDTASTIRPASRAGMSTPLGQARAHGQRRPRSKPPSRRSAATSFTAVVHRELHAESGDPGHLAVEDVARQPVRRDAVAHDGRANSKRVAYLDLVSPHRQAISRENRWGRHRLQRHRLPVLGAGGSWPQTSPRRGRRGSAPPRGWRRRCRAGSGCSWSRTGGQTRRWIAGSGLSRTSCRHACSYRRPSGARARPGRSRRRDRQRCTAEAGRRRPVGSAGPEQRAASCRRSGSGVRSSRPRGHDHAPGRPADGASSHTRKKTASPGSGS